LEDSIVDFWLEELAGGLYFWFLLEELVGVWRPVTGGHLLLGVLGSGARKP
jgi:hypothetical protein